MSWRIHITISQEWMISFLGGVLQKSSDRVCSTRRGKRKSSNQNISYINQRIVFSYAHSVCEDRVSFFIKKCENICKIRILFVPLHCKKIINMKVVIHIPFTKMSLKWSSVWSCIAFFVGLLCIALGVWMICNN